MSDDKALTTIVIPTIGRTSLDVLLRALAGQQPPVAAPVIVVDDRGGETPAPLEVSTLGLSVQLLRSPGSGPAAARNIGWRHAVTPWVSFLDDDVVPEPGWFGDLQDDLACASDAVVASQGLVSVPAPSGRRPTDAERQTMGLDRAPWITADMSVRRTALRAVGGFDERFRRAFREDADLALRLTALGDEITVGRRRVTHPVRQGTFWSSVRAQAGNSDDMLMRKLHGAGWQERAGTPRGRRPRHLLTTALLAVAALFSARGRRKLAGACAALWLASTTELAGARIKSGPGTPAEISRMILTSAVIPPAAAWHTLAGLARHRGSGQWDGLPELVLFDRDGTLIHDVPYNGDPDRVEVVPGAAHGLDRLRAAGVSVGLVTNQSAVGLGMITTDQAESVTRRVNDILGPFAVIAMCPHTPTDECECRKPNPGMVLAACDQLGVVPSRTVVVGDTAADVDAARAAGALGVLVPNHATDPHEGGDVVVGSLEAAVDVLMAGLTS